MQIRDIIQLLEQQLSPGLAAVRSRLVSELDRDPDALRQLGLLDDLWITPTGGLMLFRALHLAKPWRKHFRLTGHRYWSTAQATAHAYDNDHTGGGDWVTVTAELVPTQHRSPAWWDDIWQTILHYHERGENELRLEGEKLIVRFVTVNGIDVSASSLIGKSIIA